MSITLERLVRFFGFRTEIFVVKLYTNHFIFVLIELSFGKKYFKNKTDRVLFLNFNKTNFY